MESKLATLVAQFNPYGMTAEGLPEIEKMKFCFDEDHVHFPVAEPLVLVLIEWRLMENETVSGKDAAWRACLQQYRKDLAAAGFKARFISVKLYEGPDQKDGLILLALRRFLQLTFNDYPALKGVVLTGRFPDAAIVRRTTWAPGFVQPRQLALQTGIMCERADFILGDLQGNWEELYKQQDFVMDDIAALPDAATTARGWYEGEDVIDGEFTSTSFQVNRSGPFRDVFFLDDAIFTMEKTTGFLRIQLNQQEQNREIASADLFTPNIMARPELAVSRINAWHAAVNPDPAMTGPDGSQFLDEQGLPATVISPSPLFNGLQEDKLFIYHDSELEKDLLISYFQRNHRFRMGAFGAHPWRAALISGSPDFNPDHYVPVINNAAADFQPPVKMHNASLLQYTEFLKQPAVLKFIHAHSFNRCSWFNANGYTKEELESAMGGTPFRWTYENGTYTPGFKTKDSAADMFIHRPLWQYNQFENAGASLMIHGGCNVNSVAEVFTHRYTEHHYGHWHNAEGILFFTNCVAMLSRAKFFNDIPTSFAGTFRKSDTTTFGDCWLNYFNTEANTAAMAHMNVGRKRAYFWGISGDWTLRLRNRNGMSICNLQPALTPITTLPDLSKIGSWTFDRSHQRIEATGDLDGNGLEEIILRSPDGLAVIRHIDGAFQLLFSITNGTNAGTWTLSATDPVLGVAHFTRPEQKDMLVMNGSGLAVLGLQNSELTTIAHYFNNDQIGNWKVNTAHNRYAGNGVFSSQSGTSIIMMGSDGLVLLSLQNNQSTVVIPSGSSIGAWVLNTAPGKDSIKLIADLNGDGFDELMIASADKIGIFRFSNGKLQPIVIYSNGANISGYSIQSSHTFIADHYFDTHAKQIMVNDGIAIRFLYLINGVLRLRYAINRLRIDGWLVEPAANTIHQLGQIHPEHNRALFLVRSGWGIGFMGFDEGPKPRCYSGHAFDSQLGDWHLHQNNQFAAVAKLSLHHPKPTLLLMGV